jgi:pyridoxine 5-phosphate synthase
MSGRVRLGVNIDHVATLRNARGAGYPDPLRAAAAAAKGGADLVTVHLREDRRHIRDADVERLIRDRRLPVNLEMAATGEMHAIALRLRPHAVCLVPERRAELTTEGGLDAASGIERLKSFTAGLSAAGIAVALFIDPDGAQVEAAAATGVPAVELHTGAYCDANAAARDAELHRLTAAAARARSLGLDVHAGHGLTYDSVGPVAAIPEIEELNIGHFLVSEALFVGLEEAVRRMVAAIAAGRAGAGLARRA